MIEPQTNKCRCNGAGVVAATKSGDIMLLCSCFAGKFLARRDAVSMRQRGRGGHHG